MNDDAGLHALCSGLGYVAGDYGALRNAGLITRSDSGTNGTGN